jgi:alpha-ribazole phosphatase
MQTLYLIRHTKPDIEPGICYGQLDMDVTDSFKEEANNVLRCLPKLELVIASPLLRTKRLGEFLAQKQQCPLRSDARLMEKHFGTWEGKAWDDIARNEIDAWAADVMDYAPPGGESAQQLMQRVREFMDDLTQLPQQNIALVAHGGSLRALLALIADMPLPDTLNWAMEYGAVICVNIPNERQYAQQAEFTNYCRKIGEHMKNQLLWAVTLISIFIITLIAFNFDKVGFAISNGKIKMEAHGEKQAHQEVSNLPTSATSAVALSIETKESNTTQGDQSPVVNNTNNSTSTINYVTK